MAKVGAEGRGLESPSVCRNCCGCTSWGVAGAEVLGYHQEGSLIQDGESELQDQFVLQAPFGVFEAKSLQFSP